MRQLSAAALLLALAGCSLLFDPSKAPPRGCPATAAACPALPNATAACADDVCAYSCDQDYVDANGDLQQGTSDGCEQTCAQGAAPENPAALVATVGAAAGEVEWTFPASPSAVTRYALCTAATGGSEVCLALEPPGACAAGICRATTTGHPDNVRVTGRVTSADVCGRSGSAATAPTVGATPLDTSTPARWTHEKSCPAGLFDAVGGKLVLEQPALGCASTLVAGDELWGDFTIDADLAWSPTGGQGIAGGLALHVNGTGHRLMAVSFPETANVDEVSQLRQRLSGAEKAVAASIRGGTFGSTTHLRVVSRQGVVSWLEGPSAASLTEIVRWPDSQRRTGRVGIAAWGNGRIEVTNFRVSTAGALPARGDTALSVDLSGGSLPPQTRPRVPVAVALEPCPALPAAPGCDGGCVPAGGSRCVHLARGGLLYPSFLFDLPAGIDVRAPWHLSMRFALAPDAGSSFPSVMASTQGGLMGAGTWAAPAGGLGQSYGKVLQLGAWHGARWRFDPDGGTVALTLDDAPVALPAPAFPPAGWSAHLGAFTVGGGFLLDGWVTDVEVAQP